MAEIELKKNDYEVINKELLMELDVAKGLLEKWYKQYSDKTYTETFYQELVKNTDAFLYRNKNART
jgi:hypothetical protein